LLKTNLLTNPLKFDFPIHWMCGCVFYPTFSLIVIIYLPIHWMCVCVVSNLLPRTLKPSQRESRRLDTQTDGIVKPAYQIRGGSRTLNLYGGNIPYPLFSLIVDVWLCFPSSDWSIFWLFHENKNWHPPGLEPATYQSAGAHSTTAPSRWL